MANFNPVEGAVVLRSRGRFTPCNLYERDRVLYAKYGRSFVKLLKDERTSVDKLFWGGIDIVGNTPIAYEPLTSALVLPYPLIEHEAA